MGEESLRLAYSMLAQAEKQAKLNGIGIIDDCDGSSDFVMVVDRNGRFEYGLHTGTMDVVSKDEAVEALTSFHEDMRLCTKIKRDQVYPR